MPALNPDQWQVLGWMAAMKFAALIVKALLVMSALYLANIEYDWVPAFGFLTVFVGLFAIGFLKFGPSAEVEV